MFFAQYSLPCIIHIIPELEAYCCTVSDRLDSLINYMSLDTMLREAHNIILFKYGMNTISKGFCQYSPYAEASAINYGVKIFIFCKHHKANIITQKVLRNPWIIRKTSLLSPIMLLY